MEEKQERKGLALILSLLVGILGAVIWGLVYSTGWYVSLVAYFTAYCMFSVYVKFTKMSKLTFVWTLLWVIVLNIVATFVAVVLIVVDETGYSFSFVLNFILDNFSQFVGDFASDIGLGVLFGVLGVVSCYGTYKKQQQQAKKQKQIEDKLAKESEDKNENLQTTVVNNEEVEVVDTTTRTQFCEDCGSLVENGKCTSCGKKQSK